MRRKNHYDRIALIDRLEKKYSQKIKKLYRQRKSTAYSLPLPQSKLDKESEYLDYEATDIDISQRNLAY